MKKFFATMIIMVLAGLSCYAVSAETELTVAVSIANGVFTVSGETDADKEITILVTNPVDVICYVDQAESDINGSFNFKFLLPPGAANGEYTIKVGGEHISVPYITTVTYADGVPPIQVAMDGANILVEGNLQTGAQKAVTILVIGPGDTIYYVDQAESDSFGMYTFYFALPPAAVNGEYTINVGGEGIEVPYQTTVTYSEGLPPLRVSLNGDVVTVDGNLQTGAGQEVTILVQTPYGNIAYVDQMANNADGLYRFDFLLPPMSVNGVYTVSVGGEGVEEPYIREFTYTNGTDVLSQTMEMKNVYPREEYAEFGGQVVYTHL